MRTPLHKLLAVILLQLIIPASYAQYSVNLANNDTVWIDGCQHPDGTIYDNGGPDGNYSNGFNGYAVISVPAGVSISLWGSFHTESGYDWFSVYNSVGTGGSPLADHKTGEGTLTPTVVSTSGYMTIYFHTDGSVPYPGLVLNYSCRGVGEDCTNGPESVTVTNITTSSAQINWNATNPSGPFLVDVNGTLHTLNTNSLSLTGLNANTHYDFAISSVADDWAPCCTARESFRTACGTMDPPMQESFDDYGTGYNILPTCWTKLLNYDDTLNEPQIVGNPYSSSPGALRMYCGSNNDGNHYSMAIGPRMNVADIATMSVRFSLRAAYSGTYIIVGVCDSTLRSNNNFTPVDTVTIDNINLWEEKVVSLAPYTGTGKYIAFRMQRSLQTGDGRFLFIDDVALIPCGTWNERLYNRTYNSMWLSFDTIGSPTVNVEYGVAGFTPGTGTTLTGVSSPLRLTGLTPSTLYDVRIQPHCSGVQSEERPLQWSTLEPPDNNLNFCTTFDDSPDLPPLWRGTDYYDGTPCTSTNRFRNGNRALRMRPYYTSTMPIAVLPLTDTVSLRHLSVAFYLYSDGYTSGRIEVGVMDYPENASSFTPVDTVFCTASNRWLYKQVSLNRYTGVGQYIALRASDPNTAYNSMYIDDLQLASCLVDGVHLTNIGSHSIEIRWDTVDTRFHGDSIVVEYGGIGFTEGSGTRLVIPVRGNTVQTAGRWQKTVISGLMADSTYQFIVYGLCDTMVQHCDAVRPSAHTLPQDILLPYCMNLEGMADGSYPSGWHRPSMYDNTPRIITGGTPRHTGTSALYLLSYHDLENHSTIVLPLFETDSINGLVVSFYTWSEASNGQTLEIGVMDNPDDENTFTTVVSTPVAYNYWESHVHTLNGYTGTGRYIAIRTRNSNYWTYGGVWIDDLIVSDAAARNRTVSSITSHGATFTWQPCGRAYNGAIVEWGPSGFARGTGTSVTVDANTFSLTVDTLQPNTTYDCYITAISNTTETTCNFGCNTFTTLEYPTAASYCYGFEDVPTYGFPNGWSRPVTFDSRPRVEDIARTGNRSLFLRSYNCGENSNYSSMAVMPYLEETDLTGLTLTFYTRGYNYYSRNRLYVGMLTNPVDPATFDTIAEIDYNWSDNWQRHTIDLSTYAGTGRHIAFCCSTLYSCNDGYLYIDDITISSCDLTDIHLYSVTSHDAWLTWSTTGDVDSVEVEYINTTSATPVVITNATPPLHLAGLDSDATYTCQLRPHCTGSANSCSNNIYTFTTRTDSIVPGHCENFNWMNYNQTPQYWTTLKNHDSRPWIIDNPSTDYCTSPSRSIEFYTCSGNGNGNFLVMPATENPVAGGVISFSLRCTNSDVRNRARLTVGVITLPYDSTTFVPIRTLYPTYQWKRYNIDLSSYTGTARHIAFRYTSLDGCHYTYLDDLGYSLCRPGDLRATNITDQSVRLTWRHYGTHTAATTYTVEYGPAGYTPGSGTLLRTTDTSVTISGLTNSTSYRFSVWSSCQDSNECQQEHVTIHTLDEPLLTPFCNNFDSETPDQMPADWTRTYGDQYPRISTQRYKTSNQSLQFYSYCCNNWSDQTSMCAMPVVSTVGTQLYIDFYYYNENPNATLQIGLMTNPHDTNTFTLLHTIRGGSSWNRVKRNLSPYTGNAPYIAFRYRAAYCSSGYAYIDDITLRTCAITSCNLSGLGQDGVDVVWHTSPGCPGVWMTYGLSGSSQSPPTYHTSSPIHISGLTEATQFTVHLWPQCDSTPDNCNYETLREETLHTWVNIPYCTNFDGIASNSFPNNWRRLSTVGSDYPRTSSSVRHSENNSMQFYATDSLFSLAAMPTINPTSSCMAVSGLYANFWTRFNGYTSSARLVIGVMTDILDTNSFIGVDTLIGNNAEWEHHTLSLSAYTGNGHIIAFKLLSSDGSWCECYLDDLCIEKCVASDLTITDITQNSITVNWTSQGSRGLIVEYGPRGFAHGHGTFDTLLNSPATIEGLSELTEYEFNFKSLCDCEIIGATYLPGGGSPGTTSGGSWGGGGGTGGGGGGAGGGWGGGTGVVITTQAHYLEIPYCESYETYDTLPFPTGYRRIVGSSNLYPALTTTNHHSGESCIALYTTTDTACYMSLPPLEENTTNEMVLTFYAYATNGYATTTDVLHIGIMTNPDDPTTYTEINAYRLASTARWQQFSVDLAPYAGSGQYITFRYKPLYASYIYYIDDIYVGRCGISDVHFTTSPTTVQVAWTSLYNPSAVNIEYGRQGYDRDDSTYSPTVITAHYSPYTIVGIDPDSNYDFYIMAQCNDTDMALCSPVAYTLNPMLYPPYCQDFEDLPSGVLPDHWKVVRGRDQYPLTETQYDQQVVAFSPCSGHDNTVLLRPLPSGDSLGGKWVYAYFSTSNNNYIYLDFGTLTDTSDANTFVQMASINNQQTNTLQEFNIQLSGGNPAYNRFAIRARSTSGCRWIRLSKLALSNYPYPTALSSSVYGSSSRRITWSGQYNNPYYTILYGYGDNWRTLASDSCQALLNNLEPSQTYQVFFISPAGERLCLPYTFTTPDAVSLPYCENFDTYDNLVVPPGWYSHSAYGDNYPRTYNYSYNSCCRTLDFYTDYSHLQYTALPDFNIDSVRHLDLQFSLRIDYISRTRLVVGVMDDRADFNTFTPVDTLTCPTGSVYYPQHVSLARYNGTGRFVTFLISTTGGREPLYLDDLQVSACSLPDITVAGSRQMKASLPDSSTTADYWIEYGPQGCSQGDSTNTLLHVTQNPYYITELEPNTQYSFFTRCFEEYPTCAPPVILTTTDELHIPFCENFDTCPNYQMPNGWTRHNSYNSNYPRKNSDGIIQFYNNCNNNSRSYAVMPDVAIDSLNRLDLYFDLYNERAQFLMIVGVMSDKDDPETFIPVDTVQNIPTNSWQPVHASLHNYHGAGRFITFCMVNTTGNCNSMYIDNLRINDHPTPSYALTGATTVTVTSNDTLSPDYWIEYGPEGCNPGDTTNTWLHITSPTYSITGLDTMTTYHFYHHSDSGDVTCFPPQSVTTSVEVALPYCENFESYAYDILSGGWMAYPDCNYYSTLTHIWYVSYGWTQSVNLEFTGYCNQWVLMPSIALNGNTDIQFSCRLGVNGYCQSQFVQVGILTDRQNMDSFIPVETLQCSANSVSQPKVVNFHGLDGVSANIAFRYINNVGGYSMYMDNISVSAIPMPDINIVAYNAIEIVSDTSFPFHPYWIRLGADGVDSMILVDSTPFPIHGLTPSTSYCVTLYEDSITPSCHEAVCFTTSHLQSLPYCEEFADYGTGSGAFPTGWQRLIGDNNSNRLYIQHDYDAPDYRDLRFETYNGMYLYAVLPEMDVDSLRNLSLRATMWSSSDPATLFLEVGVMTDMSDTGSFTVVDTLRGTQSQCWEPVSARLERYSGAGRFVALRMRETTGNSRAIWIDRLEVLPCDIPAGVRASLSRHNEVRIDSREPSRTGFWLEYGTTGFQQGTGHFVRVDSLPLFLTLQNRTSYDFYFRCDSLSPTCTPPHTVTTQDGPLPLPLCINFDTCQNNRMPYGWHNLRVPQESGNDCYVYSDQSHTPVRSLRFYSNSTERKPYAVLPDLQVESLSQLAVSFWMRCNNYGTFILELGVMSDPYDASSFISIKRFTNTQSNTWQRMQAVLSSAPADARFVAFRLTKTSGSYDWLYLDDLYIDTCGASDLQVSGLTSDHLTLDWRQTGQPTVTLEYGPIGFAAGSGTTIHPASPPLTVTGLDNLMNYEFRFSASCGGSMLWDFCNTFYCDTVTLFTPAGGTGCIDPTNLTADYTTCTYGSYSNPRSHMGIVDLGNQSALSRHTVHYDTTERDPRTGGLLRTVPEGAEASVRLGNWTSNNSDPEAESVTYSLFVDPSSFDLLILKYAAVLQDPEHSAIQQPRFSIEILDEYNGLIDSRCGAADFIANANLGWNEAANDVLWKDWTTVGLDMSAYANQTIRIRLTTYDCGEGSHYGYAYFTLDCLLKNIRAEYCGEVESNVFTMPDGFNYNWYTDTVNKTSLFTTQSITIPTSNTTYFCDVSFVDKADCFFTMSAYAGTRYPLALFDSVVSLTGCRFYVQFNNLSTVSTDGVTPIGTGEGCESAYWDFGNGMTSTDYNGSTVYTSPGSYDVMLVSYLGGGSCADTIVKTLVLEYPSATPAIYGRTDRCMGDPADTIIVQNGVSYQWVGGDSASAGDSVLVLAPATDTVVRCVVTSAAGCTDTLALSIAVHPVFDIHDSLALCSSALPYLWGDTTLQAGTASGSYAIHRTTMAGCDSSRAMDLTVWEVSTGDTTAVVCDSLVWYDSVFRLTPATPPTHTLTSRHGCDSTVSLHLSVLHSSGSRLFDTVAANSLPYLYHGHELTGDTVAEVTIANASGCDSIVVLHLTVIWNTYSTLYDTVCDSELPYTWNHRTFTEAGTQYDTLVNSLGSDSLVTMMLHVLPTWHFDFHDTICSNQSVTFGDSSYSTAGDYSQALLTTAGCDSIRTLHLMVYNTSHTDTLVTACDSYTWHDTTLTQSLSLTDTLTNVFGCDSTVTLHLTVNHSDTSHLSFSVCDSLIWHDVSYSESGDFLINEGFNTTGCDSITELHLVIIHSASPRHPANQAIMPGDTVRLISGGANYIYWSDADGNTIATGDTLIVAPASTTTYYIHSFDDGLDIISNGGFESGNTGFTSDYQYSTNLVPEGRYAIGSNPRNFHPDFAIASDHTTGSGNMMVVNGSGNAGTVVWSTNIPVTPHTYYAFEAWLSSVSLGNYALMQFSINNSQLGSPFQAPTSTNQWERFYEIWNSGDDTTATITILNQNTTLGGNDFALDDISFTDLSFCPTVRSVTVSVGSTLDTTICDNMLPFNWGNTLFTSAGIQTDTVLTYDGRDSIVNKVLHVLPTYNLEYYDTICSNQSYAFEDSIYTLTGTYTHLLHTATSPQCDSIRTLHLMVNNTSHTDTLVTACDSYTWHDTTLTQSSSLTDTLTNAFGCDSTVTLHLSIQHSITDTINAVILDWNLPFIFAGDTFFTPIIGMQYHFTSSAGCDSLVILNLSIINTLLPDNVDSADCIMSPERSEWGIQVGWSSAPIVANRNIPLVGDLDGDSIPEIVCFAQNGESYYFGPISRYNTLLVFDGSTKVLKETITLPSPVSGYEAAAYGLVKTAAGVGLIIVASYDFKLRAYDITSSNPSLPYWISDVDYGSNTGDWSVNLGFADFNQDGHPELYVRNKIYNAETGTLLASVAGSTNTGSSYSHWTHITHWKLSSPFAADVCGDAKPELILGNEIYNVSITNTSGSSGNTISLARQVTPPSNVPADGHPQVADFNLDGYPDILISIRSTDNQNGTVYGYVWDVHNNSTSSPFSINTSWSGKSVPMIADIDNDGNLEVLIQCGVANSDNKFRAYKYIDSLQSFTLMWDLSTDEDSYSNSITSFDFNQDGLLELIICDQSRVRIVNGSGKSHLTYNDTVPVYVMNVFPFTEVTIMQYPLIADVDCDGNAEIVSVGNHQLNIFESTGFPWAPARKVWNQYLYNVTCVNEDLTIPQYLFNNATVFIDPDNVARRPYNNFLQQATTINQYGQPFNAVPDAESVSATASRNDDTLTLTVSYCNRGDDRLIAPYGITVYLNEYLGTLLWTDTVTTSLDIDSCTAYSILIPINALCGLQSSDSLLIALNDFGDGIAQHGASQLECDTANNTISIGTTIYRSNSDTSAVSCDSLIWHGLELTASCDTTHVLSNIYGCDSVVTMHLTVYHSTADDTSASACDQFTWHDSVYTATATASFFTTGAQGCDSVTTLHLTVNHSSSSVYYDTCTENQLPRVFHGLTAFGDTANASVTITNAAGCDSVISYHLHVLWNNRTTLYDTICDSQLPYVWNHRTFTTAGTQYDTLMNSLGTDSLVTMVLHVLPTYHIDLFDTICSNQSLAFEDSTYSLPGTYTRGLLTATLPQCDSVRMLHLTVLNTSSGDTSVTVCDSFTWHDSTYLSSTTLFSTSTNAQGCDSVTTLHLTVNHSDHLTVWDTICTNQLVGGYPLLDTLFYPGTSSGLYALQRTNSMGCDSTVTLALVVHDNSFSTVYDTIVENQASSWMYNGVAMAHDTANCIFVLANHWGCDSTINYNLHIWRNSLTTVDSTICDNQYSSFVWYGQAAADTLRTTLAGSHGTDSTVVLALHVNPTYHFHRYDTICDNRSATLGDTAYSLSGDYSLSLVSSLGCDSTVTLHLTVYPTYHTHLFDTIFPGDTVFFEGDAFTQTGDYNASYSSALGCDSVITLHLYRIQLMESVRFDTICEGDTFYFYDRPLTLAGTYRDTIASASHLFGDTIVVENLSVLPYPTILFDTTHQCKPEPYYTLTAHTDAPYLRWSSRPSDNNLSNYAGDSILLLNPSQTTTYRLTADYSPRALCPTDDSITLIPIHPVEARIAYAPDFLSDDNRRLEAYNNGHGPVNHRRWEVWYNDMPALTDTSGTLRLDVPMQVDSLVLFLTVTNLTCADTDTASVPILKQSIYFPNVFTPGESTNNTFFGFGTGILQFEIWIYDRRGDLVFHSTDFNEKWNGTHNGVTCHQGTYVYRCRYTTQLVPNGWQSVTGTVTLLR
ncbi:MAG: choice-of-anchor J domain-containing protein [Bacteroidales bacterium]|nr:choice-of-anchor J domain-containing protein [Bacteroidales bacterium]